MFYHAKYFWDVEKSKTYFSDIVILSDMKNMDCCYHKYLRQLGISCTRKYNYSEFSFFLVSEKTSESNIWSCIMIKHAKYDYG